MNKRILILTAGFGEGHNSAARGVRDGLARVAPNQTDVELRDLFAEAYGLINDVVRRAPGESFIAGWIARQITTQSFGDSLDLRVISLRCSHVFGRTWSFAPSRATRMCFRRFWDPRDPANVWRSSRTRSPLTPRGTGAPRIISSLRTNRVPRS